MAKQDEPIREQVVFDVAVWADRPLRSPTFREQERRKEQARLDNGRFAPPKKFRRK